MSKTQTRGNCQLCGRQQAVRGSIAQHGYTVEHGYFNGVCAGHRYRPLQVERIQADRVIAECRADAVKLEARAVALRAREADPTMVAKPDEWVRRGQEPTMVVFAELPAYAQARVIESFAMHAEQRAQMALGFAADLEKLADALHGTALVVVQVAAAPARIQEGDRRLAGSGVLVARYQDGGRVYWQRADGKGKGWTGTAAWRAMEVAP